MTSDTAKHTWLCGFFFFQATRTSTLGCILLGLYCINRNCPWFSVLHIKNKCANFSQCEPIIKGFELSLVFLKTDEKFRSFAQN